eukprot:3000774-Rhodomonas_salina.1
MAVAAVNRGSLSGNTVVDKDGGNVVSMKGDAGVCRQSSTEAVLMKGSSRPAAMRDERTPPLPPPITCVDSAMREREDRECDEVGVGCMFARAQVGGGGRTRRSCEARRNWRNESARG